MNVQGNPNFEGEVTNTNISNASGFILTGKIHAQTVQFHGKREDKVDGGETAARGNELVFGGDDTVALLVAGKAKLGDGSIFLDDVRDMTSTLISIGLKDNNIYESKPGDDQELLSGVIDNIEAQHFSEKPGFFIFYYTGHCTPDGSICLENKKKEQFFFTDKRLKKAIKQLSAKKILIILDTCYSAAADHGARKEEVSSEELELIGMPRLWDIFDDDGSRDGASSCHSSIQVLQWCSCKADEGSRNKDGHGKFTGAIINAVKKLSAGTTKTILELHNEVKPEVEKGSHKQSPVLKPDKANTNSETYFSTYPKITKR